MGGFGTQTAALAFGGGLIQVLNSRKSEEYDGSSWTEVSDNLNTARKDIGSAGTQTAGLVVVDTICTLAQGHQITEEYDGSYGHFIPNLNTTRLGT